MSQETSKVTPDQRTDWPFKPSPSDVYVVRAFFGRFAPRLPPEIVDSIIELAEYWPCSRTVRVYNADGGGGRVVSATTGNAFLVFVFFRGRFGFRSLV
jgi:hypothetical protein